MKDCARACEILKKNVHLPTILKCDGTRVLANIFKDVTQHVIKKVNIIS